MWRTRGGLAIVESEVSTLTMAMKRGQLWTRSTDSLHPTLLQPFLDLKRVLVSVLDLAQVDPNEFLSPFLDVIRSENVTGPVTGLALSAVNKFLAYGLLDTNMDNIATAVENLADAVTHAR
jgi:brefeldin A-resistance guanine nucleotide exchange factor 1